MNFTQYVKVLQVYIQAFLSLSEKEKRRCPDAGTLVRKALVALCIDRERWDDG